MVCPALPGVAVAGLLICVICVIFIISGCDIGRGAAPGGGAKRRAQPPVPVAVSAAARGAISSFYSATTTLEVDKEAQVLARVSGIVESIDVEEGDIVDEDGILLAVENEAYRLRLEKAKTNREILEAKFDRIDTIGRGLVSLEDYELARNDLAAAKSEEELASLDLSYTTVRAPFRGRVTRRLVDVGQNVGIDTPLFVVADFEPLLARVHVPAKEFRKLQTEQIVELVLDSDGGRLEGRVTLVSPIIDPSTGTIKVTVEVPEYPERTRPGDFAEVHVVTERRPACVLVPKTAVISDKGERVVFVVTEEIAERRVVEVGFTDDRHTEIVSGVDSGEAVIVKGQRSLKHGSPVKVLRDAVPRAPRASSNG